MALEQRLLLLLVALSTLDCVTFTSAFVHDSPECGEPFHCPDECVITWYGKCPSNCYCKPIKRCETVNCPYPPPACIIVTGQDGCQRCACENETKQSQESTVTQTTQPTVTYTTNTVETEEMSTSAATEWPKQTYTKADTEPNAELVPEAITESNLETITQIITELYTETVQSSKEETTTTTLTPSTTVHCNTNAFTPPIEIRANATVRKALELYAQKICTQEYKRIIDSNFKELFTEIGVNLNKARVYPSIYTFEQHYLRAKCHELKWANQRTPLEVRRSCFRKYYVFDELVSLLSYPCSAVTGEQFFGQFSCTSDTLRSSQFAACLPDDVHSTVRLQVKQLCDVYKSTLPCMQEVLTTRCSERAWTIYKQYLVIRLLKLDPHCGV